MTDTTHLQALITRRAHEREYLAAAKSQGERDLRAVWIAQIEREIADEEEFLGMAPVGKIEMSDDELLAELV